MIHTPIRNYKIYLFIVVPFITLCNCRIEINFSSIHHEPIFVQDNFIFKSDGFNGFQIFDSRDPVNVQLITNIPTPFYISKIHVHEDTAFILTEKVQSKPNSSILIIFNISNIYRPIIIDSLPIFSSTEIKCKNETVVIVYERGQSNSINETEQITMEKTYGSLILPIFFIPVLIIACCCCAKKIFKKLCK